MKMRILSMLLAFAMLFGMMPAVAFAEDTEPVEATEAVETTEPEQSAELVTRSAFYVNPLYADMIDAQVLESAYHQNQVFNSGAGAASENGCYTTPAEAAVILREAMENRATSVVIPYEIPAAYLEYEDGMLDLGMEMFDIAFAHTGVPTQGDYLLWHYQMWGVGATGYWNPEMTAVIADLTFTLSYHTDAAQEAAVTSRVNSLLAELNPTGTDYQKIKTVYDWMCANIDYDYDNLNDPEYYLKYSAYAALINGTSVCQGYANLLYRLALEMGIDCRIITGYSANGSGTPEAHAWNIVKLGDSYYNLDATWDSARTTPVYFLKSQASFENHYRNSDYTTSAFNAAYPMGESDFDPSQDAGEDEEIIGSGTCLDNLTWKIAADGTMTISGVGDMYFPDNPYTSELEPGEAPWADYANYVTNIVIEEGVTNIYFGAFRNFSSLESISIPDTVTQIWDEAFMNCYWLQEIDIPDSVSRINSYAFAGCSSLTSVVVPEGVTVIDYGCFSECYWLSDVSLPSSLERISDYAFFACALRDCVIPNSVTYIGEYAFYGCSYLNCSIPDSVTEVGNSAFGGTGLTNVVIPNGITKLDAAFKGCTELKSVTIPESVTSIGAGAFQDCSSLTDVVIPANVTLIGDSAFKDCTCLTDINIPDGVTALGSEVFSGCENLKEIALPESITSIGSYAFYECASLEKVNIPSGIAVLEQCVFARCYNLKEITIPYGVTTIGASAFEWTMIEEIIIPDTVTSIGWAAFCGCRSLKSIDIPSGVTELSGTFDYCLSLTSIELPDTLTYIGQYTFADCDALTSITIPKSVAYIEDGAFRGYGGAYPDYDGCDNLEAIVVSDENESYTSVDGVLFDKNMTRLMVYPYAKTATEYVVPESVQRVDDYVFYLNQVLTSITLPPEISEIGNGAFLGCEHLATVYFTGNAPYMAYDAFGLVDATAYFPLNNETWTDDVFQNYQGTITWVSYDESQHIHNYQASVTAPTCTEKGYTTYTCPCGDSYVADEVPALNHDLGDWAITDATCTVDGSKTRACSRCDYSETEVLTAPGHSHVPVVTAPTCTEKGYTTYTCACGDTYVADEVPALNHDLGDWVITDATCIVDGSKTRACSRCDFAETEVITAPGHSHVPEVTAPTCTEKGYTTYTCACGDFYVADETAALGHNHAYSMTKAPTESVSGSITGICTRCGDEVSVTLPKLNKDDYTYEVELEPTEEAEGIAHYLWKNTDYGVYSFDVVLNKLAAALGDVSGDGEINVLDLMYLANYFAKGETINKENADVNKDGSIDVRDLMFLANVFAGKETLS